ncbi:hypothetical protein HanIR_Chr09g0447831 [Helianthus annuus]|nr:hypothetical protein HanIR_Chr09g0447831 [Helianthus annuus]
MINHALNVNLHLMDLNQPFLSSKVLLEDSCRSAELGGKIYEMMTIALGGKLGSVEESKVVATTCSSDLNVDPTYQSTTKTKVVEPSGVTDPFTYSGFLPKSHERIGALLGG